MSCCHPPEHGSNVAHEVDIGAKLLAVVAGDCAWWEVRVILFRQKEFVRKLRALSKRLFGRYRLTEAGVSATLDLWKMVLDKMGDNVQLEPKWKDERWRKTHFAKVCDKV